MKCFKGEQGEPHLQTPPQSPNGAALRAASPGAADTGAWPLLSPASAVFVLSRVLTLGI